MSPSERPPRVILPLTRRLLAGLLLGLTCRARCRPPNFARLRPRPISLHRRASTSGATRTAAVRPRGRTIRSSPKSCCSMTARIASPWSRSIWAARSASSRWTSCGGRVRSSAGVEQVFFFASHTHSGPFINDAYPTGKAARLGENGPWTDIAAAIEQAAGRLQPAALGVGEGEVLHRPQPPLRAARTAPSKMLWRNATKTPTHPVDSRGSASFASTERWPHAGRGRQLRLSSGHFRPRQSASTRPTIRARRPASSNGRSPRAPFASSCRGGRRHQPVLRQNAAGRGRRQAAAGDGPQARRRGRPRRPVDRAEAAGHSPSCSSPSTCGTSNTATTPSPARPTQRDSEAAT